jgi:hypothetical protein
MLLHDEKDNEETSQMRILDWEFDTIALDNCSNGQAFQSVTRRVVLQNFGLLGVHLARDMNEFFEKVGPVYNGDSTVAYHNSVHGADVCQAFNWILQGPPSLFHKLWPLMESPRVVLAACVLGSAMHDFGHPGYTAKFLMNSGHSIALHHGDDLSCLERFHGSQTLQKMEVSGLIFHHFSEAEERLFRKTVVELILATSLAAHGSLIAQPMDISVDYMHCLKVGLHCADVSNSGRPQRICHKWTDRLLDEFRAQGEAERILGLQVSFPIGDRTAVIALQMNFFQSITRPLFVHFQTVCPEMAIWIKHLEENEKFYIS